MSEIERTKTHWDVLASEDAKRDLERRSWGGLPQIARNHNQLTTGRPEYYWIDYLRDQYFQDGRAGDVLSVGCGEGAIERLFKERGFVFDSITGIDLSEKCIQAAEARAREVSLAPRIAYMAADLNRCELPRRAFDFIFFFHSLHHVKELEFVLGGCAKALRPRGILMANEFVGPSRFQWTDKQLQLANDIFRLLPAPLRYDLTHKNTKTEIRRPSVEEMMQADPSEAVRSAEIEALLRRYFQILEEKNWGGTLNHLIFEDTAGNYDLEHPWHNAILELLIHHENCLIENGVLPSNYKFFVAGAKPRSLLGGLRRAMSPR